MKSKWTQAALCGILLALPAFPAATITIQVLDAAGVGFNDATAAAPVGGNTGTTLGQQRLIAFQNAANIWGATLTSSVPIIIGASWEALTCNATSAVLGSAGAWDIERDFTGAPRAGTWYPVALANKLFGSDLTPGDFHIRARFNVNLGNTGCLTGIPFYLGVDANHGSAVDLVAVLLHEFGHGLGFQTFTSGSTGAMFDDGTGGKPSIWDWFLLDNSTGKTWVQMTNAERATSSLSINHLVWSGATVASQVPAVLPGSPNLRITAPPAAVRTYQVGTASFGSSLAAPGITAEVWPVVDTGNTTGLACNPLTGANLNVAGKIALVDRGTCAFVVKVKNCQNAGAIGVLVADNAAGSPPAGLGGSDPTITIPSVRITQSDGILLRTAMATRSRTHTGMFATLGLDPSLRAGADGSNRMLMYAPNPYQGGSSVSHYDTTAFPNQLMEPAINGDLTHTVVPPKDLTFPLFLDIGW